MEVWKPGSLYVLIDWRVRIHKQRWHSAKIAVGPKNDSIWQSANSIETSANLKETTEKDKKRSKSLHLDDDSSKKRWLFLYTGLYFEVSICCARTRRISAAELSAANITAQRSLRLVGAAQLNAPLNTLPSSKFSTA